MKARIIFILLFFLLSPLAFAQTDVVTINNIHIVNVHSAARITLDLSSLASVPRVFVLSRPDRLVLDFKNTQLAKSVKHFNFSNVIISGARQGLPFPHVLRLVFDVRQPIHFKKTTHKKTKQLTIDLYTDGKPLALEKNPLVGPLKKIFSSRSFSIGKYERKTLIVVIDPGHGGSDPGAVGLLGATEKEIVLSIAKQLAAMINRHPSMRAVLTRYDDRYISLHNRLVVARRAKADLFIAVHADSYFNKHAIGASVYALSEHGATSIAARWLAKRENYSELNKIDLSELTDQSYILRSVLIDLAQTATIRDSLNLGNSLLGSLQAITRLHHARVEQAPFMVLKSPDIPSILVEIGFISNSKEELRLRDLHYQHKIASALFAGIQSYQNKYTA